MTARHRHRTKPPTLGRSLFRSILHHNQPTIPRRFGIGSLGTGKNGSSDLELAFAELDIQYLMSTAHAPQARDSVFSL
jgi:hypothetical protein